MSKTNYGAILVATLVVFVFSSLYYSPLLVGKIWRSVDPVAAAIKPSMVKGVLELIRTLILTLVITKLVGMLGVVDWKSAIQLAVLLWFGFSALMWTGAVMWEHTPWALAAIHSGDWLFKTVLICLIVGVWRR